MGFAVIFHTMPSSHFARRVLSLAAFMFHVLSVSMSLEPCLVLPFRGTSPLGAGAFHIGLPHAMLEALNATTSAAPRCKCREVPHVCSSAQGCAYPALCRPHGRKLHSLDERISRRVDVRSSAKALIRSSVTTLVKGVFVHNVCAQGAPLKNEVCVPPPGGARGLAPLDKARRSEGYFNLFCQEGFCVPLRVQPLSPKAQSAWFLRLSVKVGRMAAAAAFSFFLVKLLPARAPRLRVAYGLLRDWAACRLCVLSSFVERHADADVLAVNACIRCMQLYAD